MIVRLVSHRQPLALQFLTALAVDLQAAVDLVDLAVVLKNSAHTVRSGREFRTPNDLSITVRGNKWFDHSKREGGYAIRFVQR